MVTQASTRMEGSPTEFPFNCDPSIFTYPSEIFPVSPVLQLFPSFSPPTVSQIQASSFLHICRILHTDVLRPPAMHPWTYSASFWKSMAKRGFVAR